MQTTLESGVSITMIKEMAMPLISNTDEFALAKKVAFVLEVSVSEVLTWYRDTESKMLAIYMEILMDGTQCPRQLAIKYHMHPNYMQTRLREIYGRMQVDVVLQAKILKLNRFFLINDESKKSICVDRAV